MDDDRFRPDAALLPLMPLDMRAEWPDEPGPLRVPFGGGVAHFPNATLSEAPASGLIRLQLNLDPNPDLSTHEFGTRQDRPARPFLGS